MTVRGTATWSDSTELGSGAPPPAALDDVLLAGRYRLQRMLGRGASGVVYEAVDEARMGARVALKLLVSQRPGALARLKNEFRGLARTVHPNLVGLHGLGADAHGWFVVMDLVTPAVDFLHYVRGPDPRCDTARLRHVLVQLLRGVAALHASGKLHRDLKPSNVLVDASGRVVIVDFGLLGDIDDEAAPGARFVGTPAYAAPEQVRGLSVGPHADMYAVGVMLYEALTGGLPIDAPTPEALLAHKLRAPPLPLGELGTATDLDLLCAELLAHDVNARPTAERALALLGEAPAPREAPRPPPFVARKHELAQLSEAAQRTRREGAGAVLLRGPSGIGKSALGARFCELARTQHGALVLHGRCHPLEQVPYKAFDTLIDSLAEQLARMSREQALGLLPRHVELLARVFPTFASVPALAAVRSVPARESDPALLRARAFGALRELLARIADQRPLVLCVDDLHWSDQDSMVLLRELWQGPDAPALLFVAMLRSDHPRPALLDEALAVLPDEARRELELAPLAGEASLEMARQLLGARGSEATSTRLVEEAGGSPLLLTQLARAARSHGVARSLSETVVELLSDLPDAQRSALELICVAGHPVPHAVLLRAVELDGEALRSVADSWLLTAHVQQGDDQLEPHHDRLREAVLETLSPARQRALHHDLARALLHTPGADPEQIAAHFWSAEAYADAAPHLAAAGERAMHALAFARAAELYQQALAHAATGPVRDELELSLARALASLGKVAQAAAHYEGVLQRTRQHALRQELYAEAMVLRVLGGDAQRGAKLLDAACRELGQSSVPRSKWHALMATGALLGRYLAGPRIASLPVPERARHQGTSKQSLELSLRAARVLSPWSISYGEYFALRTLLAIRRHRDRQRWPVGIAWELLRSGGLRGRATAGEDRDMERAITLAEQLGDADTLSLVLGSDGVRCYSVGRYRRAADALAKAERVMTERGLSALPLFDGARSGRCACWWVLGEYGLLREHAPGWIREAEALNDSVGELAMRLLTSPVQLADDHPAGMREAAHLLATPAGRQTLFGCDPWWYGDPALYVGDVTGAWQAYQRARRTRGYHAVQRGPAHRVGVALYLGRLRLLAAREGDRTRQLRRLERVIDSMNREAHPVAAPVAALLSAGAANLRGDHEGAGRWLNVAATGFEALEMVLYAQAARFQEGRLRGGDAGREVAQRAVLAAQTRTIRNPERIFHWMAPGFP